MGFFQFLLEASFETVAIAVGIALAYKIYKLHGNCRLATPNVVIELTEEEPKKKKEKTTKKKIRKKYKKQSKKRWKKPKHTK